MSAVRQCWRVWLLNVEDTKYQLDCPVVLISPKLTNTVVLRVVFKLKHLYIIIIMAMVVAAVVAVTDISYMDPQLILLHLMHFPSPPGLISP
jgi:hypothetical protein